MNNISKILIGVIFIMIGVIIGLNAFGVADINIFFDGWWTLFIIVPSFIGLFKDLNKTGNIIALVIGVTFLLSAQNIISFSVVAKLFIPIILVIIGLSIIFNQSIKGSISKKINAKKKDNLENIIATFAEQKVEITDEFKDSNIDAVFGGVTFDLRNAKLKKENVVVASAIFGGIKIIVPKDLEVKVKSTPIFGGVSKDSIKNNDFKNVLYVDATAIFGGVEIKYE